MQLQIGLPDDVAAGLRQLAKRVAMSEGEVAAVAIKEFLRNESAEFLVAMHYWIEKNKEVLTRLAE